MNHQSSYKFDILKLQMEGVQKNIARYGQVQFVIKGWAITLYVAILVFYGEHGREGLLIVAGVSTVLFLILDSIFKGIQKQYIDVADEIEDILIKEADKDNPLANVEIPHTRTSFKKPKILRSWLWSGLMTLQLSLLYILMLITLVALPFLRTVFQ